MCCDIGHSLKDICVLGFCFMCILRDLLCIDPNGTIYGTQCIAIWRYLTLTSEDDCAHGSHS